jgi:hypothetical protein
VCENLRGAFITTASYFKKGTLIRLVFTILEIYNPTFVKWAMGSKDNLKLYKKFVSMVVKVTRDKGTFIFINALFDRIEYKDGCFYFNALKGTQSADFFNEEWAG